MKNKHLAVFLLFVCIALILLSCGGSGGSGSSEKKNDVESVVEVPPARRTVFSVGDVDFAMRDAPAAVFPVGLNDDSEAEVTHGFRIAETPATYELWYEVRTWGEENGYRFRNAGREGSGGADGAAPSENKTHPVTVINMYDAIVWCNALSEYLDYAPVYTVWGEVYRDANDYAAGDNVVIENAVGFRLATSEEWALAARFRGDDASHGAIEYPAGSGMYWSPGTYASGANGPYGDEEATKKAAWYNQNSNTDGRGTSIQPVGQKPAGGNGLFLYDMSGNVFEWLHLSMGVEGVFRGGCYGYGAVNLQVGDKNPRGAPVVGNRYTNVGLRVVLPMEAAMDEPIELIFSEGDSVEARYRGQWRAATILDVREDGYYIHYDGYHSSWDEWVPVTRVRTFEKEADEDPSEDDPEVLFPVGSLVEVSYGGSWYKARVLATEKGTYYITYEGYASSWDEWVDPSRIRSRVDEPVIASVTPLSIVVDYGLDAQDAGLPESVETVLADGGVFVAGVLWDITPYDSTQPGEYELTGELIALANVANPYNLVARLNVVVLDPAGAASRLRIGGDTDVDGLLFYIESDSGSHGYYFGTSSEIDATHMIVEDAHGFFLAMIVFDQNMYPIHWVFPDLSIEVVLPWDQVFDPRSAMHIFIHDDRDNVVLDISLNETVGTVLDRMPVVLGNAFSEPVTAIRQRMQDKGWISKTVEEVAALAKTPHEISFATMLSMTSTGIRMIAYFEALLAGESDPDDEQMQGAPLLSSPMARQSAVSTATAEKILDKLRPGVQGTCLEIVLYLYRIHSGHYDGRNIDEPMVSMLICRGASSVPYVCHEFYIPYIPGNLSRCVELCYTSINCFTDICHPMKFGVIDSLYLRGP